MVSILDSMINMIRENLYKHRVNMKISSLTMNTHKSSKIHEKSGYNLDLDSRSHLIPPEQNACFVS